VVGAVDHTGNTIYDIMQFILQIQMGGEMPDPIALVSEFIAHRPSDVSFMIDEILHAGREGASNGGIALNPQSTIRNPQSEILQVDPERIGMAGHSFGGWTTLMVTARDHRIRAALPLAPAGGSSPLPVDPLREALDFNWGGRDVPTLFLTASRDSLLPLAGMHELLANTPAKQKKMIVLENADHMHFCDKVEQIHEMFRMMPPPGDFERIAQAVPPISELCPGEHAYQFSRALGLAHMDAHLKGDESAAQFLSGDVCSTFATRGVNVRVVA
jgi:predicted dienelactone hydrolase